jgi:hypothetical protein
MGRQKKMKVKCDRRFKDVESAEWNSVTVRGGGDGWIWVAIADVSVETRKGYLEIKNILHRDI